MDKAGAIDPSPKATDTQQSLIASQIAAKANVNNKDS
jgi:hypothetical protein